MPPRCNGVRDQDHRRPEWKEPGRFCSTLTLASSFDTPWSTSCTCLFAKGRRRLFISFMFCPGSCTFFLLSLLPQLSFLVARCYYSTASILLRHSSTHFWISFHSLFNSSFFGDYRSLRLALSTDFRFPSRTHSSTCGLLSLGLYYSQWRLAVNATRLARPLVRRFPPPPPPKQKLPLTFSKAALRTAIGLSLSMGF